MVTSPVTVPPVSGRNAPPPVATAAATNAVVAMLVSLSPTVGVGAVGLPEKAGEASGAFAARSATRSVTSLCGCECVDGGNVAGTPVSEPHAGAGRACHDLSPRHHCDVVPAAIVGSAPSVVRMSATVASSSTVFAAAVTTALSNISDVPPALTTISPLSPSVRPEPSAPAGPVAPVSPLTPCGPVAPVSPLTP